MLINHYLIYVLIARLKAYYNTIKISLNLEKSYHKGDFYAIIAYMFIRSCGKLPEQNTRDGRFAMTKGSV